MAGELPPLIQAFAVQASEFLAGIDSMVEATQRLATVIDETAASAERLSGVFDAAGAADERFAEAEQAADDRASALVAKLDEVVAGLDEVAAAADRTTAAVDDIAAAEVKAGDAGAAMGEKTAAGAESGAALGGALKTAFLGVGIAAVYGVVQAAKFQSSMTTLLTQAGVAKSQFKGLESGVLTLAGQVGFSPTSLAAALYHVESSFQSVGITGPAALNLLRIAAEGAATGHANLVDVTNALDATIASGVSGVKNYSQAMGALNAIVGAGDMTMQDLADAMGTGLMAVAKSYGQSLIQVGAAMATLGDNNIRGAKAATDLRMSWQAVQAPMKGGIDVLNKLGLQADTLANTMTHHGLTAALQQFVQHLQASHVPVNEWGQMITEIFGKRAGVGIGVLVDQLSRLQGKLPDVQHGADSFGQAWVTQGKTIGQQWADLKSGLDSLAIAFGSVLMPAATKVVGVLAQFATFLQRHADLAAFAGGLLALAGAFKVASMAMAAFGEGGSLAMLANPVFLVVAAIAALAFGLYELYRHSKLVRDIVADVGRFFKTVWADAMHAAGAVVTWFVNGPLAFIKQQLAVFSQWWASHGKEVETVAKVVWHAIADIITTEWKITVASVKAGLAILADVWRVAWVLIRDTVKMEWDVMAAVVRTAFRSILDVIGIILDLITGHWGKAWHDLVKLASDNLHGAINVIKSIASGFGTLLWDAGKALIQGLINGIKSMFGSVGSVMGDIGHLVKSFLPFSPAKQGPLSGAGDPRYSGQSIARNLALGITDGHSLVHGAMTGLLSGGLAGGLAGGAGGLAVAGGGAVAPNLTIHLTVNGYVGSNSQLVQELGYALQSWYLQANHRNATNGLSLAFGH